MASARRANVGVVPCPFSLIGGSAVPEGVGFFRTSWSSCAMFGRYKFTEFDPNRRLKRGAKKGSGKFKSKAKFKRKK